MIIETKGLKKTFETRKRRKTTTVEAVKGVDLSVEAGAIFGFLGPNGAGKTTTLRMLATLIQSSGGEARINGYDLRTQQVVRSSLLSPVAAREVVQALREAIPGIAFAVERLHAGFGHEPAYVPRWDSHDPRTAAPIEELLTDDVVKLLARHEQIDSDSLLAAAYAAVPGGATLTHSSGDGLLEMSAEGVSKASGLAAFAEEHGVSAEDVIAFGDMPNDLPMLHWAGTGVAVANAHPEVLAAADEVTASNDDDGVAEVLARWF